MSSAYKCEECGDLHEGTSTSSIKMQVARPLSTDADVPLGKSEKEDLCASCVVELWQTVFGDDGGED